MRYLVLLPLILLGACAAPDISAFKQSTLALTTSLNTNQANLESSGTEIAAKLGNPSDMQTELNRLSKQGKQIKQFTAILSSYTESVAQLASAGKNGAKAAESLADNLKNTITGSDPGTDNRSATVTALTTALGSLVQQSKNKELFEIMGQVKKPINSIADELIKLPKSERGIVNAFTNYWKLERQDLVDYNLSYTELQKKLNGMAGNNAESLKNSLLSCANPCDYEDELKKYRKAIAENAESLGKIQTLLNEIQIYEESFQVWTATIEAWKANSHKGINDVPALAQAWKKDHNTIIKYLEDCTKSSGIFKRRCGAFSVGNLELFGTLIGKAITPF